MIRVWSFCSCIPRPSLVSSALLSLGHHIPPSIFRANSLAPFDALLDTSTYFPSQAFGNPVSGEKGRLPLWLPQAIQGCHGTLGFLCLLSVRVHLWREMRVHGMIRGLVSALSGCWPGNILVRLSLGDLLNSRRNKLNKKLKDTWPKY